ncbi:hypothetical protein B0D95_16045 [Cellvibrio sp. PSBB023]|nr:hypothetical protein B0D95_16045 [Cellvibrio sp. PSBB023]
MFLQLSTLFYKSLPGDLVDLKQNSNGGYKLCWKYRSINRLHVMPISKIDHGNRHYFGKRKLHYPTELIVYFCFSMEKSGEGFKVNHI